jgi:hypothetical protein
VTFTLLGVKRHAPSLVAALLLAFAVAAPAQALGGGHPSHAPNWSTRNGAVLCGIADVHGTEIDPGTGAPENGVWPGLQCSARGIPRGPGRVGDPFVQLGRGRAGRARLVNLSQDDLLVSGEPKSLSPGRVWARDGIRCLLHESSISCHNADGHGFTLSPGRLHLH